MKYKNNIEFAQSLDNNDPFKEYRNKFHIPAGKEGIELIYFAGNSLGLQPKTVRQYVEQELLDWEKWV